MTVAVHINSIFLFTLALEFISGDLNVRATVYTVDKSLIQYGN